MKRIAIIPIDNRPICYTLLEQICAVDGDIKLHIPPRKYLGGLITGADINGILAWFKDLPELDNIIISLDTIAYGGLVSSRRSDDSYEEISQRLEAFKKEIKGKAKKVFAFSSVMRISNNNINEEEKEYWNPWGKRIFEYSYHLHKSEQEQSSNCVLNNVPSEILQDYINTRERNFNINKLYLEWLNEGILDFLVYSKDDSARFGLNIKEANQLQRLIEEAGVNALVKTGADEIPLALLSRALCEDKKFLMASVYLENAKGSLGAISKYEDISVQECVLAQMEISKVTPCNVEESDTVMFVNNFQTEQGDLVLGDRVNYIRQDVFRKFEKMLSELLKVQGQYCIADINNANGADNNFIYYLFQTCLNTCFSGCFSGYAGYNTTANTIGCVICIAAVKFFASKYNEEAFRKLQMVRFMDDWAYQANVRKNVRDAAPDFEKELQNRSGLLDTFKKRLEEVLDISCENVSYSLPWKRSFEIEIEIK